MLGKGQRWKGKNSKAKMEEKKREIGRKTEKKVKKGMIERRA